MESSIHSLRVETYRSQLAVCEKVREKLSKELENANLTRDQRIDIGRRWDAARKESGDLQFMLKMMERQEIEAKISPQSLSNLSTERRRA